MEKVLIVDDNKELLEVLTLYFSNNNFEVVTASDGRIALEKLDQTFDLVILDIMMPNLDGKETIKILRQKYNVPVMFISAKVTDLDKFEGLMLGADDYILKPFIPNDVVTKAKVLVRRYKVLGAKGGDNEDTSLNIGNKIQIKGITIILDQRIITKNDQVITLTKTEFNLLVMFAKYKNIVLTPEKINDLIFDDPSYFLSNNSIAVHIKNLRYKIEDEGDEKFIKNVWGVGYKIEG